MINAHPPSNGEQRLNVGANPSSQVIFAPKSPDWLGRMENKLTLRSWSASKTTPEKHRLRYRYLSKTDYSHWDHRSTSKTTPTGVGLHSSLKVDRQGKWTVDVQVQCCVLTSDNRDDLCRLSGMKGSIWINTDDGIQGRDQTWLEVKSSRIPPEKIIEFAKDSNRRWTDLQISRDLNGEKIDVECRHVIARHSDVSRNDHCCIRSGKEIFWPCLIQISVEWANSSADLTRAERC